MPGHDDDDDEYEEEVVEETEDAGTTTQPQDLSPVTPSSNHSSQSHRHRQEQQQPQPQQQQEQQQVSVAHDLHGFVKRLVELSDELRDVPEEQVAAWVHGRLLPLCRADSHNLVLVHALLRKLAGEWVDGEHAGFALRRIIEELDRMTANENEARIFSEVVRYAEDLPPDMVASLTNIYSSGKPTAGDIIKLHRTYQAEHPPPIEYLRASYVMEALLADCFGSGRSINHMDDKLWLLAFASSAVVTNRGDAPDTTAVQGTFDTLKSLEALFNRVTTMAQMQDHLETFLTVINEPISAMVVLYWLDRKVVDPDFYEWTSFTTGDSPPAFHVLDEIAIRQPEQRNKVFSIWKTLFEGEYKVVTPIVVIQFKERFLDHFLLLVKTNYMIPVFQYLTSQVGKIDHSLIVYFLHMLLSQIELPSNRDLVMMIVGLVDRISPESLRGHSSIFMPFVGTSIRCLCCISACWQCNSLLVSAEHIGSLDTLSQADMDLVHSLSAKLL
ncbi:TH1 protein-domain-containing protein [Entophlyctis helioformis]|nr:TH1 protein-domain-containing protein [Entophlyctis helioformis]